MPSVQINGAVVQNIGFTSVKHFNSGKSSGGIDNITEINGIAGTGNPGAMLRNTN